MPGTECWITSRKVVTVRQLNSIAFLFKKVSLINKINKELQIIKWINSHDSIDKYIFPLGQWIVAHEVEGENMISFHWISKLQIIKV